MDHYIRIRETDDPSSPHTARQQLARALHWHRVLNGWSQETLGLVAGLDHSYVGAVERVDNALEFFAEKPDNE